MLKSLYSGVSGLQSHQVAMDVESNNIANVNTIGFKYSRANFSDLLAQTRAIATAPQGALGGKNAVQVGLGSTVSSMTRIFSQGSVQNTDKNTDMAIQGDGFFIISPDGGNTYKYTRSGDFKFDAGGNFVDNNGFIAQGWLRDKVTGKVDATAPITNINIPPGLTTPANPTAEVVLKANLSSGPLVTSFSPTYEVPAGPSPAIPTPPAIDKNGNPIASSNMGVMFNEAGEAFSLQANQGIWAAFENSTVTSTGPVATSVTAVGSVSSNLVAQNDALDITIDGVNITLADSGVANTADTNGVRYAAAINAQLIAAGRTGIAAAYDSGSNQITISNTNTASVAMTIGGGDGGFSGLVATPVIGGNQLDVSFTLDNGDVKRITTTGGTGIENAAQNAARYVSAINGQTSVTGIAASYDSATNRIVLVNTNSIDSASHNIKLTALGNTNSGFSIANDITAYRYQYDPSGSIKTADTDKKFTTIADLREAMEVQARTVTVTTPSVTSAGVIASVANNSASFNLGGVAIIIPNTGANTADANGAYYETQINAQLATGGVSGIVASYNAATDTMDIINSNMGPTTLDTIVLGEAGLLGFADPTAIPVATQTQNLNNVELKINSQGKFELTNPGGSGFDYDINLSITGMNANSVVGGGITENTRFTRNMEALNSVLPNGTTGKAFSQSFNDATHSSGIDIFDSLGSKHTVRVEFRKTSVDSSTGSTWSMLVSVPPPATINTVSPTNEKMGSVRFNNDGSLATYNPPNVSFSGNNGSAPQQQVNLNLGTANAFDGMTSFDAASATSGISQDGFTGGDLIGIRIDQSGTLVGSFSNGRSFGLAQMGMAKFTNNEGLGTEGGNIFVQSANSGDPIIGTAATSGRGFIQSSALEASNVDLSSALTQLIIIQRGYQANGKTITTSDTLLETLLGIKR
ncbi:flagellar hook-basal body complex protein [Sulfurimonas sp.]|uniref:flagellar hook-basal body complex protein n=1 Tax=Sulfurimonas sp. TaxID=2022749 RepID=UPI0025E94C50|nr:flagellar hook-basal body complex protein [Sulfurimonas sp.]MDD5157773.1 flagellar hook-basal body complex protein [Sulfurimonas sp.]